MSDAKQVLKTILGSKKISYDVSMAAALGSPIAAILFSQACFYQFNSTYQELTTIEGLECFTKTTAEWVEATGLTDDMVTSARKILTSCGIFREAKMGLPAKIYTHVDIDAIVSVLNNYKETGGKVVKKEGLKNRESVKDEAGKFAKKPKFPIKSEPCLPASKFPILSEPVMPENRKLVPYFIGNKYKYNTLIFSLNKESIKESLMREGKKDFLPPVRPNAIPDASNDNAKGKRKKAETFEHVVTTPETHKEIDGLLQQLLKTKNYKNKTPETLEREMSWFFSCDVRYCKEQLELAVERNWMSLKYAGAAQKYQEWQQRQMRIDNPMGKSHEKHQNLTHQTTDEIRAAYAEYLKKCQTEWPRDWEKMNYLTLDQYAAALNSKLFTYY